VRGTSGSTGQRVQEDNRGFRVTHRGPARAWGTRDPPVSSRIGLISDRWLRSARGATGRANADAVCTDGRGRTDEHRELAASLRRIFTPYQALQAARALLESEDEPARPTGREMADDAVTADR